MALRVNHLIGFGSRQASGGGGGATDPNFADVKVLAGFNGTDAATTAPDESPVGRTLTFVGNAQIDTAQAKFGSASLLVDGNGDAVTAPNASDLLFGNGQFTVECFVRLSSSWTTLNQRRFIVGVYDTNSQRSWALNARTNGATGLAELSFAYSTDGSAFSELNLDLTTPNIWADGAWYHLAVDRDSGGVVRLYSEGAFVGKSTISSTFFASSALLSIGNSLASGTPTTFGWVGWIDELRITKGVARYASDSGFTVPTAAYPRS